VARWQCQKSWTSIRTNLDRERSWWKASRTAKQALCIESQHSETSREPHYESAAPQVAVSHASFYCRLETKYLLTKFLESFVTLNLSFNLSDGFTWQNIKKESMPLGVT
jgi:hypothetical protein